MDSEKSGEVLDVSEAPQQQEEAPMDKEVGSKLETAEESAEPQKPPAEDGEQPAVNGHDADAVNPTESDGPTVTVTEPAAEEKAGPEADLEPVPDAAAPEPDESSEKVCDPEPENTQPERPPVPENEPEPLPVQTPLADSAPEPEPEKVAESLPEAEAQTSPEPAALQQPVDTQPPGREEQVSGQVEAESKVQPAMEEERAAEADAASEKPAGAVTLEEEEKKEEPEKVDDTPAAAEGVKAEEEAPAPAPSSLSFALLEQDKTKDALRASRTLVVLRGLPGSGKSFLAGAIADAYKDHCSIICADDLGVKPEDPESSVDGYKAVDEAVVAGCSAGPSSPLLLVVDDTNHTQDRLARLGELSEQHGLVVVFLEPRTEWSRDPAQLTKKTARGLEEAQLEAMRAPLEEATLPLYFGWFLLSSVQDKVRCTSMDFMKTLDTLEAFKKHLMDFTGKAEKEVDLEQYFKAKGSLHCTTKFCDYGKADGASEYAQAPAVGDLYGSVSELSLTALFVTPRTVGARVSLTEEQLLLWPAGAEKDEESVPAAAGLPRGSRAHVTLGCADGVEPVQTGLDLLEILALQQEGQKGEVLEEMELGPLTYYGEGRWLLSLREPICSPACFSSFYGPKQPEPPKKEPEKKKKQKCAIL
ncbi:2',3'-cyclic-nucleotide 3'-phosphodiesterase [Pempheris klunzingeri]|uniref:2',3'-cyclic-nucleotide 3'-phosphodiesterase n=1 Tax=Pempheris klunzingeri TaxID=3127111 RepID=UPI00398014F6